MLDIYDILGVGFGPSNIALAIALDELEANLRYVFLDRSDSGVWQGNMLLNGSDIQNNPLRDLVTPRNPQSHYTFINYLKQSGRLFDYLNLGVHYPLRKDYAKYIAWVAQHFSDHVRYSTGVADLEILPKLEGQTNIWKITTDSGEIYYTRCLVLGHGRTPNIPQEFKPHLGDQIFHLNHYLPRLKALNLSDDSSIAVLGSSQSAVEILLDLLGRNDSMRVYSISRSYSFRLKDTSPFSDHVYFPEFIDYFYEASKEAKRALERQLRPTNYSSADGDVIHQLYLKLYEEKLDGNPRAEILNNTAVEQVEKSGQRWQLTLREIHKGVRRQILVDGVVLATGFLDFGTGPASEPYPPLLGQIKETLPLDEDGVIQVQRDYSVPFVGDQTPLLYLNGLCEATHGLGDAGSFSLVSLRSMEIARSALRKIQLDQAPVAVSATSEALIYEP